MLVVTAAKARIIGFYRGERPDDRGRYLSELHQRPEGRLKIVHDFAQWMFLLPETIGFNPEAPTLDRDTAQEFRMRPELQQNLRASASRSQRQRRSWKRRGSGRV